MDCNLFSRNGRIYRRLPDIGVTENFARPLLRMRFCPLTKSRKHDKIVCVRGVAQLVARLLWEQDAAGSNPVTPTTAFRFVRDAFSCKKQYPAKKRDTVFAVYS